MHRIAFLLLVLTVISSGQLLAATEFSLDVTSEASPERNGTWRVHAEGREFRADRQGEDIMYDAVLSTDSESVIFLNSALKTWFDPQVPAAFSLQSRFLTPLSDGTAKKIRWELESKPLDGGTAYTGLLAYVVSGDAPGGFRTAVSVNARIEIETTHQLAAGLWPGTILPLTKYKAVDERLAGAESQIEGFPIRLKLTAVRTYDGGAPYTDVMTVNVSDISTVPTEPARFEKPAGYRYERPVVAAPGVTRTP